MLDEKDFINNVWNKYEYYSSTKEHKNKFLLKNVYKSNKYILAVKSFITFIISLLVTSGIVYAGITTYKFIQSSTSTNFNSGFDYNQNMTFNNSMYYKMICTYEEYIQAKETWDNLVDIEENEFKDYFIIVIAGENYNTTGLYISDIYTKEEIYKFKVDCNDVLFTVCINSKDLLGQPEVGRRFKGQIWMQGILNFEEVRRVQRS